MTTAATVAGIDGWKGAWVAVVLRGEGVAHVVTRRWLRDVLELLTDAGVVGVDVPIGLPEAGARRRADEEARKFIGARRSSVFFSPPSDILRDAAAMRPAGVSAQSFALRDAIREAHAIAAEDPRVVEVHPEVSFAAMALENPAAVEGRSLARKRSWNGMQQRRRLLADAGIEIAPFLGDAGEAAVDDVLDAAAVAWSARRIAGGHGATLPADPPLAAGRAVAIHY